MSGRYGKPNEGELKLRSRPEAFPADYFVDTGTFACEDTKMLALEAYYRPGPLLVGTEYFFQWANAPEAGDPFFHGGEVVVSWLLTGETRDVQHARRLLQRGLPAQDRVPRRPRRLGGGACASLHRPRRRHAPGRPVLAGDPMLNWHLSDNVRLEAAYGYGQLDRFDLTGGTQFFQSRIQLTF